MRLVRIARDRWDVQAACDSRGSCQVLDFLSELGGAYEAAREGMLALLHRHIPVNGLRQLREPLCKPLGNDLFEFRREPKGRRLRVIWFYDVGRVVVCACAFTKDAETPRAQITRALRLRAQYFSDQRQGLNRVEDP